MRRTMLIPVTVGVSATATAAAAWLGVAPGIETQFMVFANLTILSVVLLRKQFGWGNKHRSRNQTSSQKTVEFSNTSWFVIRRLGKKRICPEAAEKSKQQNDDANVEIGDMVTVVETIEPDGGKGQVKYRGMKWHAKALESIACGELVKITGRDVLTLMVEKIKTQPMKLYGGRQLLSAGM